MEQIIYVKRFIKTEDDLPAPNWYFVYDKIKGYEVVFMDSDPVKAMRIANKIDWYLQLTTLAELIKEKLPSDKIEETIRNNFDSDVIRFSGTVISDMVKGANIVINKLTDQ